jgi:NAD(P) transhydrogenase subunit beta
MEDINGEFGQADVAIILGANDVVNPAAHTKGSAIYGMPILEAYKAKTIIVNKRSMAPATPASTTSSSTWTRR